MSGTVNFIAAAEPGVRFIGLTNFQEFIRESNGVSGRVTWTSPILDPEIAWHELVLSWNAACPAGTFLIAEARAFDRAGDRPTSFFSLGQWSEDPARFPRTSVRGQKEADGEVATDILICAQPKRRLQLRFTLGSDNPARFPVLKFAGVALAHREVALAKESEHREAWGKVIEVPQRSQLGHVGAEGWCSPTAVSMVLAHWASVLHRPDLDLPVPEVARGVHDPHWPGTGNWSFNVAFAGSFRGLRAYVTRCTGLDEIERWIGAGIPVIASVSFDLLNGKEQDLGTGHLIVVVGFTREGDVVVNDPWPDPRGLNRVRKTFPRAYFIRAWPRSRQTLYLIHPEAAVVPASAERHW